jgi:glycerophosphoryl diester phosphodiesterase
MAGIDVRRAVGTLAAAALLWGSGAGAAGAGQAGGAPPGEPLGPVLVVAHRGASGEAPEHTFAAYDLAVEQDTDVLECDLQLTADEVLVCVHDLTVDRTTGGQAQGRVDSYTLDELRAMDFGSWFGPDFAGASIVPFEEQLRCYRALNPTMRFYVETKAPADYGGRMEPLLVDLLERLELVPEGGEADAQDAPVIVQSFEHDSLAAVKALAPSLPTAWLWSVPPPEVVAGEIPDDVDVLAPAAAAVLADPTLVQLAHDGGRPVHVWTVDDPGAMGQLLDLGVDGMFTNQPAVLRGAVDERDLGVPATQRANPAPGSFEHGCPGVAGTAPLSDEALADEIADDGDEDDDATTTTAADGGAAEDGSGADAGGGADGVGADEEAGAPSEGDGGSGTAVLVGVAAAVLVAGAIVALVLRRRRPAA